MSDKFTIPDRPSERLDGRVMDLAEYLARLSQWGEMCHWTAKSIMQSYEELKAEYAALRQIAEVMAKGETREGECCHCWMSYQYPYPHHDPDCIVMKAREALAQHSESPHPSKGE